MTPGLYARVAATLVFVSLAAGSAVAATAATVSKADGSFVKKVSQGGSYEVQAGQLAMTRAMAPAVKAFAEKDVADHDKVNGELKSIAGAQGIALVPSLNASLQKKRDKLASLSGAAFDRAYVRQMAKIHQKDEGIFAKEAQGGTSSEWKAFAGQTDEIVKGHIAILDQIGPAAR